MRLGRITLTWEIRCFGRESRRLPYLLLMQALIPRETGRDNFTKYLNPCTENGKPTDLSWIYGHDFVWQDSTFPVKISTSSVQCQAPSLVLQGFQLILQWFWCLLFAEPLWRPNLITTRWEGTRILGGVHPWPKSHNINRHLQRFQHGKSHNQMNRA